MFNRFCYSILFLLVALLAGAAPAPAMDKAGFYNALSSNSTALLDEQLQLVRSANVPEKEAYEGALLMKKAGLINGTAKEKLNLFRSGNKLLEASIARNPKNIEYRFLRLIIQEHAPRVLKYRANVEEDSDLIRRNYKNLGDTLQDIILDYSKNSKALQLA